MSARKFFGLLFRSLACGFITLLPLMIGSVKLGNFVDSHGLWRPSAGIAALMFLTGFWAPLVAKMLFKKYRMIDLNFVWVFGFMIGGWFWSKDHGPLLLAPEVTSWDVLTATAVVLPLSVCLVVGSWVGVLLFAGGKDTWREWIRRFSKYEWIDSDDR